MDLQQIVDSLTKILDQTKAALSSKGATVPETTKFANVPTLIGSIKSGSGVELVISASDYEGETLTAQKGEKQATGLVVEGIARISVDEEGEWTVSGPDGNSIKVTTDMTFEGELSKSKTYGVTITEPEPGSAVRVTYRDDAVGMSPVKVDASSGKSTYNGWEKTWIFEKVYPVMLSRQGEIVYRLDREDHTKREDGGASDVASIGFDGNAMVCIEKFYTKFSMDGQNEVVEICDQKKEGFEAIGFIREDGSEADNFFVPMFPGSYDNNNRLRSISGQTVKFNISWTDFRTAAQKNGSGYDIETWAMNQALGALWVVLMKDCNPQTAIGAGRIYTNAKTGVTLNKGAIGLDPSSKAVKFLYIEDFTTAYSNGFYRWEAGILAQSSKVYVKMKPPYSGTSTSGYTQISDYARGSNYVSRMKCSNAYGRYAIAYEGSSSTYEAAYWSSTTGADISVSLRADGYGVAGRDINDTPSYTGTYFGAALSFLPPA